MEFVNKKDHHKVKGIIILMKCLFGHFVFEKQIGLISILLCCLGVAGYMTCARSKHQTYSSKKLVGGLLTLP